MLRKPADGAAAVAGPPLRSLPPAHAESLRALAGPDGVAAGAVADLGGAEGGQAPTALCALGVAGVAARGDGGFDGVCDGLWSWGGDSDPDVAAGATVTDANTNANADTNANTDANTNADANTDANTDTAGVPDAGTDAAATENPGKCPLP
jgi:hypothetical protein